MHLEGLLKSLEENIGRSNFIVTFFHCLCYRNFKVEKASREKKWERRKQEEDRR